MREYKGRVSLWCCLGYTCPLQGVATESTTELIKLQHNHPIQAERRRRGRGLLLCRAWHHPKLSSGSATVTCIYWFLFLLCSCGLYRWTLSIQSRQVHVMYGRHCQLQLCCWYTVNAHVAISCVVSMPLHDLLHCMHACALLQSARESLSSPRSMSIIKWLIS